MPSISELRDWVQAQFNGPLAGQFSRYGGVDVTLEVVQKTPARRVGRPRIVLSLESDVVSRFNGASESFRDCVFKFVTEATENSGSLVGAENPIPSQVAIARALQDYLEENALDFHRQGYMMPEVRTGLTQSAGVISTCTGRYLFTYERE